MTKQMGNAGLTFLAGMALATPAFAASSMLTVDNRFDGEAEVWLDGRFQGLVSGDSRLTMETRPGHHQVKIARPGTDYVLVSTTVQLHPHETEVLSVLPPRGQLRVDNRGDVRLKVAVEGQEPVWIAPGSSALVTVLTGHVDLKAAIHDPRGEWIAQERDVWVEPGQLTATVLRPDPTVLVIHNQDSVPVRAMLDGVDAGWIPGGTVERVWVRPGPTFVVLLDKRGAVRSQARVVMEKGDSARIIVQPSVIYPNQTVVSR